MLPPSKIASKRNHNKEINGHGHGQQKNGSKAINEKNRVRESVHVSGCQAISPKTTKKPDSSSTIVLTVLNERDLHFGRR